MFKIKEQKFYSHSWCSGLLLPDSPFITDFSSEFLQNVVYKIRLLHMFLCLPFLLKRLNLKKNETEPSISEANRLNQSIKRSEQFRLVVLNQGQFCSSQDIWQRLETSLVVTAIRGATSISWVEAWGAVQLPTVSRTAAPTIIWPQISLALGNPGIDWESLSLRRGF